MSLIHMVCGVPGSGKTWVCSKLKGYVYLPHDDYPVEQYGRAIIVATRRFKDEKFLIEAPFRISHLIDELRRSRLQVVTYMILEPKNVVMQRYMAREGKPILKQHLTNYERYKARRWDHVGTAEEILALLSK